jgi:uncharacterized membrane protein
MGRTLKEAMMKKTLFLTIALVLGWLSLAMAQVWVDPYVRKDGTQVGGHYRSSPDGNPYNNWSYPGNTNPYTGRQGTGDPNRYLENYNRNNSGGLGGNSYNNPSNRNRYGDKPYEPGGRMRNSTKGNHVEEEAHLSSRTIARHSPRRRSIYP